jgi:hypothetical protein
MIILAGFAIFWEVGVGVNRSREHIPTVKEIVDALVARTPRTSTQQSQTGNAQRSMPSHPRSPKPPTFTENDNDFLVSVGQMSEILHEGEFRCEIAVSSCVIGARIENHKVLVTANLYSGPGFNPLEVRNNQFTLRDSLWDRNFDDTAFEVVNQDLTPMMQIVYTTPHNVHIYGVFQSGGWVIAISPGRMSNLLSGTALTERDYSAKRLFRYPSRKYFGQEQ